MRNSVLTKIAIIIALGALTACGNATDSSSSSPSSTPTKQVAQAPVEQVAATEKTPEELGKRVFAKCRTCHTLEENGRHKVGPNLWAIYGKTSGTAEGFAFSKAMKEAAVVWDDETISAYMENPRGFMPKNKMAFVGLKKPADRENLLAYLKAETQPK